MTGKQRNTFVKWKQSEWRLPANSSAEFIPYEATVQKERSCSTADMNFFTDFFGRTRISSALQIRYETIMCKKGAVKKVSKKERLQG